jgi:hypothetical protein
MVIDSHEDLYKDSEQYQAKSLEAMDQRLPGGIASACFNN